MLPLGAVAQSQETLLIYFNLEVPPLDVHLEVDGLQEFLVVGDAMSVPKLCRLVFRLELVWQGVKLFIIPSC